MTIDADGVTGLPAQHRDHPMDRDEALAARCWVPGEAGIWALIFTDLGIFTVYFIITMYEWGANTGTFAAGHRSLDLTTGILNTFFLLTASLFVALGVQILRQGRVAATRRLFLGAGACGAAFVINKYFEWSRELAHGHGPHTDVFFQLYFVITGIHLAHVLIAMTLLGFMRGRAAQVVGAPTPKQSRFVENCASYWHMVDLLWLGILALYYLMG